MNNVSMTGLGIIGFALIWVLKYFGVAIDDSVVTLAVANAAQVLSTVMVIYGQLRRKDLVGGILRK